jgi:hypothetical protein
MFLPIYDADDRVDTRQLYLSLDDDEQESPTRRFPGLDCFRYVLRPCKVSLVDGRSVMSSVRTDLEYRIIKWVGLRLGSSTQSCSRNAHGGPRAPRFDVDLGRGYLDS